MRSHGRERGSRTQLIEPLESRRLLSAQLIATLPGYPKNLQAVGDALFYTLWARKDSHPRRIEMTDGTAAGTRAIVPPAGSFDVSDGAYFVRQGDRTLMSAALPGRAHDWWTLDERTGRATPLDVDPPWPFYATPGVPAFGDHVYYSADYQGKRQLFRRDRQTLSASVVMVLNSSSDIDPDVRLITAAGDRLFFVANASGATPNNELWVTDGTDAGTRVFAGRHKEITSIASTGRDVVFATFERQSTFAVWMSDGVQQTRIATLRTAGMFDMFHDRANLGNDLIFSTDDYQPVSTAQVDNDKLWKLDASGSLTLLRRGPAHNVTAFQGKVYFIDGKSTLFVTDGTAAGTRSLGVNATHLVHSEAGLFFSYGKQIWSVAPPQGAARGITWNDKNANGSREPDEEGIPGRVLYLDVNRNRRHDAGEPSATTRADGTWRMPLMQPGRYVIRAKSVSGWEATTPTAQTITLHGIGGAIWDLGAHGEPGAIAGTIYNDFDGNGLKNHGEAGMAGMRVFLDSDGDGKFDGNETWVRSDSAGRFRFDNVPAGSHQINVGTGELWKSSRELGSLFVEAATTTAFNVYLKTLTHITARPFLDANRNGLFEQGETDYGLLAYIDLDRDGRWSSPDMILIPRLDGSLSSEPLFAGRYRIRVHGALLPPATGQYIDVTASSASIVNVLLPIQPD